MVTAEGWSVSQMGQLATAPDKLSMRGLRYGFSIVLSPWGSYMILLLASGLHGLGIGLLQALAPKQLEICSGQKG